ncbi:MAG: response regulator transcription factor [Chloroflexi bacterium]|nr:response regulator transcription factor [Chloroflexota bacterium]
MARILVVEDERLLRELLVSHLQLEGYDVRSAADGEQGLAEAREFEPEVCVLDVMLPRLDGLSLCRILRRELDPGIIMLTARASEIDRVIGLDSGADDYVVKPFSLPELTARVRAALRRAPSQRTQPVLQSGDLKVDLTAHRAWRDAHELRLTHKEFELLALLMRNRGAVLTRDLLLSQVWGDDFEGDPRTIDVHVRWLREKIEEDPSRPLRLQTVRGVGYRFD